MLVVVLLLNHVWLFCNLMDCSPLGSSIHGTSQAWTLDWVAVSFFRESFRPRDRTHVSCVSCIDRWILYLWATKGVLYNSYHLSFYCQLLMLIWPEQLYHQKKKSTVKTTWYYLAWKHALPGKRSKTIISDNESSVCLARIFTVDFFFWWYNCSGQVECDLIIFYEHFHLVKFMMKFLC